MYCFINIRHAFVQLLAWYVSVIVYLRISMSIEEVAWTFSAGSKSSYLLLYMLSMAMNEYLMCSK